MQHTHRLGSIIHSVAKRLDDATLTVVLHASVLVGQADVRLLLAHHRHVLVPQAGGVAGEDEGVAVGACAVLGHQPARVVHGVVVVVGVDDPVDVVCGAERLIWLYLLSLVCGNVFSLILQKCFIPLLAIPSGDSN